MKLILTQMFLVSFTLLLVTLGCDRRAPGPGVRSAPIKNPASVTEQDSSKEAAAQVQDERRPQESDRSERKEETQKESPPVLPGRAEDPLGLPKDAAQNPGMAKQETQIPEQREELPPLAAAPREFPFEIPNDWKRLAENEEIWIDQAEHRVVVSGRICLRQGMLEMFACPRATKEHESIVATYPISSYIHQALLLVGAEPGRPVQWEPEYQAATGPKVQIECWFFNDQKELQKTAAREMVRKVSDKSLLDIEWVFVGSRFVKDFDGREFYAANGGELICLSNFSSAMIDLPIQSTDREGDLLFEANPDKIPALDTPVLLVLKPEIHSKTESPPTGK